MGCVSVFTGKQHDVEWFSIGYQIKSKFLAWLALTSPFLHGCMPSFHSLCPLPHWTFGFNTSPGLSALMDLSLLYTRNVLLSLQFQPLPMMQSLMGRLPLLHASPHHTPLTRSTHVSIQLLPYLWHHRFLGQSLGQVLEAPIPQCLVDRAFPLQMFCEHFCD